MAGQDETGTPKASDEPEKGGKPGWIGSKVEKASRPPKGESRDDD